MENRIECSNQQTGEQDFLERGQEKVNDLHRLLFNKAEEFRRDALFMGAWEDRIQYTPSEEAQVKGGRRNKGKKKKKNELEENGIQTTFRDIFVKKIRGIEIKAAEAAEGTGGCEHGSLWA